MEKKKFDYSLKNIPLPDKRTYQLDLIEKIESVLKRMRWKAHFFLSDNNQQRENFNTYGFKSRKYPPHITLLDEFEKDLYDIVSSLKYRKINNDFQKNLKKDISEIISSKNMFIFANKTNKLYEMDPEDHEKLITENITKTYQKAQKKLEKAINMEAKNIANNRKPTCGLFNQPY